MKKPIKVGAKPAKPAKPSRRGSNVRKGDRVGGALKSGAERDNQVARDRCRAFVNEYCRCWNAGKAARAAGLRGKSAHTAWAFLRKPMVQEMIRERMMPAAASADLTAELVTKLTVALLNAVIIEFASWTETELRLVPSAELTREQAYAIKKVKQTRHGVEIELYDRTRTMELAARILSMINVDPSSTKSAREHAAMVREILARPLATAPAEDGDAGEPRAEETKK